MTTPPRPPRSDRFGMIAAVLGGLAVALAAVLVIVLVSRDGSETTTTLAADTTAAPTTAPTTTTAAPDTTAASTTEATTATTAAATTTAAPTTTATTVPPFDGTLDAKSGPQQGTPAGRLDDIRAADHAGFARLVFDFPAGGIPGYFISYTGPTTLTANFYPLSWTTPYDAGIFDAGGNHAVGEGSIVRVHDGGMSAGSGEWAFEIIVTSQKPFRVGTLDGPPRIYVDIGD